MFSAATASALCNYMVSSTMALVAPLSGWLSDRIGSRLPTYDRALRVVSSIAVGMPWPAWSAAGEASRETRWLVAPGSRTPRFRDPP